jgi:Ni/Co efflux regulator RcnB
MKKLLLIVVCVFFTHTTFAQSERDQKIQKVQEKKSQRTNVNNNNYNQGYQNGYNNGINEGRWNNGWNRTPYYYNPYDVGYYPYWNTNRTWDRHEYVMTRDSDLIQKNNSKPMRLSFGVIVEQDAFQSQMSPYIITGGETFMVIQYHTTLPIIYPYYDNISTWEVEDWGDESAGNVETKGDFSIGAGRTMERFSPYMTVGITTRKIYNSYYDEFYVLSSESQNGIYLINQQILTNMSIRGGFLYHWNYLELIGQVRYDGRFGIGAGLGIKL